MAKLIALCGAQRAGKTTAAGSLVDNYSFLHYAFADPIYAMVSAWTGLPVSEIRLLPKHDPLPLLHGKTLRNVLQTLGTGWGREMVSQDIWVRHMERRLLQAARGDRNVVVDDCRCGDEYLLLESMGARFVRIVRDDGEEQEGSDHRTEQDWHHFEVDGEVVNCISSDFWTGAAADAVLAALGPSSSS